MLFFENKSVKLLLDPTIPSTNFVVKGPVMSAEFRESIDHHSRFMTQESKNFSNLKELVDLRLFHALSPEDVDYAAKILTPEFFEKIGIRYRAFVLPEDIFGQMAFQNYDNTQNSDKGMVIKHFGSLESARNWLLSLN